jgi:hypothetical protein
MSRTNDAHPSGIVGGPGSMRNVASRKVNRLSTATTRGVDAETVTAK